MPARIGLGGWDYDHAILMRQFGAHVLSCSLKPRQFFAPDIVDIQQPTSSLIDVLEPASGIDSKRPPIRIQRQQKSVGICEQTFVYFDSIHGGPIASDIAGGFLIGFVARRRIAKIEGKADKGRIFLLKFMRGFWHINKGRR